MALIILPAAACGFVLAPPRWCESGGALAGRGHARSSSRPSRLFLDTGGRGGGGSEGTVRVPVAVVTGAGTGLGREVVQQLLRVGFFVAVGVRCEQVWETWV